MIQSGFQRWAVVLSFLCITTLPDAYAWNKATHMAIGAMAYKQLKSNSPQTLTRAIAILKQHPYYQKQWVPQCDTMKLTAEERDEYLFMLAARWPDDIKGRDAYHDHFNWHFINYVYAPQKGIARSDSTLPTGETILQAYELNRQVLSGSSPDSSKAVALCWIFHLTGDVHMPLHTLALVAPQFPKGDQGGNLFMIRVMMSSQTMNLHAFWDGMLLGSDTYRAADQLAVELLQKILPNQLPQLGKGDIISWSKESFQLAQDNAYRNNTLKPGEPDEGTILPADYVATVKPIAERQVMLSGYRLANELVADLAN